MTSTTRMGLIVAIGAGLATSACNKNEMPAPFEVADRTPQADRDAPFDPPNAYPGWAYDSPSYVKPAAELTPEARAKKGDPLHYFTNKKIVMVRAPDNYQPEEIPRVAIWWTDNNGFHWHKGGYFGRQQKFFPFEVEEDGDYGIRFVGPDQASAQHALAHPERVYHVDSVVPEVEVRIEPEQSWYYAGQKIMIAWRADDCRLTDDPVSIRLLTDFTADAPRAIELQRDLAHEGSITYQIPAEMLDHEIRIRIDARDRANNLGIAYSYALQIVEQTLAEASGGSQTAAVEESPTETERIAQPPDDIVYAVGTLMESKSVGPRFEPADGIQDAETDVDLSAGEPAAVPFGAQAARRPNDDGRLTWSGPTAPIYPAGNIQETSRSAVGLFDMGGTTPDESPDDAVAVRPADGTAAQSANDAALQSENDIAMKASPQSDEDEAVALTPVVAEASPAPTSEAHPQSSSVAQASRLCADRLNDDAATGTERRAAASVKARALLRSAITVIDPTHGNGLLIPLPATVEASLPTSELATAHPWRILGEVLSSPLQTVWALPRPRFSYELNRMFDGRFLADHPLLRPVAEPGAATRAIAGLPSDTIDAGSPNAP